MLDILNKIKSQRSTKFKSTILEANKDNELLKKVFYLTYSPEVLFGIKKVDMSKASNESLFCDLSLNEALNLIEVEVCSRNRTGHDAHTFIADIILNLKNPNDSEVIHRILNGDLECGASVSLANKVWPKLIKIQPQNLATSNSDKAMERIKTPAIIQLKEDGARCFAEFRNDEVLLITRGSNTYQNLDKLSNQLKSIFNTIKETLGEDYSIDGELVAFKDGVRLPRQIGNGLCNKSLEGSITKDEADCIKFIVWDLFPLSVHDGKGCDSYINRFNILKESIKDYDSLVLIESQEVDSIAEAKAIFLNYLTQGLEGAILKNYDCKWVDGRNPDIVKMKLCEPIEMEIIDVYAHTKDPNKLGGITVRSNCEKAITNCGSGFKDTDYILTKIDGVEHKEYIPLDQRHEHDREYLWSIKDTLVGQIVTLETGGPILSKSRKDDTYSLFLPIFKGFRKDRNIANNLEDVFDLSLFS